MATEQGYRVPEVTRVVGISYRQLDYWARTGLVRPSIRDAGGSGTQRLYSFQDLLQLKVIKKLLDAGVELRRIRKAIDHLKAMGEAPHGVTLYSDGVRIYEAATPEAVVDLLAQGQGVFAIAVDKVWNDLEGSLQKTKAGRRKAAGTA